MMAKHKQNGLKLVIHEEKLKNYIFKHRMQFKKNNLKFTLSLKIHCPIPKANSKQYLHETSLMLKKFVFASFNN